MSKIEPLPLAWKSPPRYNGSTLNLTCLVVSDCGDTIELFRCLDLEDVHAIGFEHVNHVGDRILTKGPLAS